MDWNEVRAGFPDRWLLVEALHASSEGGRRIIKDLAVVASFADSASAMRAYAGCHHELPARELYVAHSSRATLDVEERSWLGLRALG